MAKKSKKQFHPVPTLGWLDKLIYYTAMALALIAIILSLILYTSIPESIAFCDPDVIARTQGVGNAQFIWLILWLTVAFILICIPYSNKKPIFGKKGVKYGPPAYLPVYPLFMKNKPYRFISPKELKRKKKTKIVVSTVLIITFLFSVCMFVLSFSGRAVMNIDGTITVYNACNQEVEHYSKSDISSINLETYRLSSRQTYNWTIRFEINTDDETFHYYLGSFKDTSQNQLNTMLYVKEKLYPNSVTISNTENLQKAIDDQNLSSVEEQQLIYELFEVTQ